MGENSNPNKFKFSRIPWSVNFSETEKLEKFTGGSGGRTFVQITQKGEQ